MTEKEKLIARRDKNDAEIKRCEEKQRDYQREIRIMEAEESGLDRKRRNHRIFTRGGMLEAFLLKPLLLTDEQVHSILKFAFSMDAVDTFLKKMIAEREAALTENERNGENGEGYGETR